MATYLSARVRRRLATGGVAVLILAAAVACGDSGGGETTAPAATPTTDVAKAQTAAFCTANLDLSMATSGPPPGVDFETATPEQIQAALKEYAVTLEPTLAKVAQSAPPAIRQDTDALIRMAKQGLEGDQSVFESPEFVATEGRVDGFLLQECGWEQTAVTATDHEYAGAPSTLPAATRAFTLSNEGEEIHELAVVRINDGVTLTIDEVLALPMEQAMQMVTPAASAFAGPGGSDTTFAELTPGRYGLLCFIPEGSVPPAEGEGPPHFTLGMKAEFTVA